MALSKPWRATPVPGFLVSSLGVPNSIFLAPRPNPRPRSSLLTLLKVRVAGELGDGVGVGDLRQDFEAKGDTGLDDLIPSFFKEVSPLLFFPILSPKPKVVATNLSTTGSCGNSSPNILGFLWRFIGTGRLEGRFGDTLDLTFVGEEGAFVVFDGFVTSFIWTSSPLLHGFRFDRVIRLLSTAPVVVLVVDFGVFDLIFEGNVFSDGLLWKGEEGAVEESVIGELGAGEDELRDGVVFNFLTHLLLVLSSSSLDTSVEIFLS